MRPAIETPTNTRWYSFVYELRSAAEAPVELMNALRQERDWSYAVFFPGMEATSTQPAMPPAVCVLCERVLCIYRIGEDRDVTRQEVSLARIDRLVLRFYLAKCALQILWPGGSALFRFPVHGTEHIIALCDRLAGPNWERTVTPEPVLGYGIEITLRRLG
jgi:hypothetical protein